MYEDWETGSSDEKFFTGSELKKCQYILSKKLIVQKKICMRCGLYGVIKRYSVAAQAKRQVLPYFLTTTFAFKLKEHIAIPGTLYNL